MSTVQRHTQSEQRIAAVREALCAPQALQAGIDSVEHVLNMFRGLLEENEGLAGEVLRGYEQLNLIFDFTRQIATVTDPDEIVDALLCRMARILDAPRVALLSTGGKHRCHSDGRTFLLGARAAQQLETELQTPIQRVREANGVVVEATTGAQALVGALARLDHRIDVVVALRSTGAPAFETGDMLIAESVLAFAGQIISNSDLHERMRRMSMETARALIAAIDKKDHYTRGHSERVALLARLTGRELQLPAAELQTLEWAGLLHDVGKIGVPESILQKPGKLTPEEFDVIRRHPAMGYEILKPIASLGQILDAVLYHHENPDGTGYPAGLSGDAIPLFARIIHVVDVFDALSSSRAYRPAFTTQQAKEIIAADSGTKLDRACTEAFLRVIERLDAADPDELAAMYAVERGEAEAGK